MHFRYTVNRGEAVRGRPTTVSKRETNLRALVKAYAETPPAQRDKLKYLQNVQYHLSENAFSRLLPPNELENPESQPHSQDASEQPNSNEVPSTSQASGSSPYGRRNSQPASQRSAEVPVASTSRTATSAGIGSQNTRFVTNQLDA